MSSCLGIVPIKSSLRSRNTNNQHRHTYAYKYAYTYTSIHINIRPYNVEQTHKHLHMSQAHQINKQTNKQTVYVQKTEEKLLHATTSICICFLYVAKRKEIIKLANIKQYNKQKEHK